MHASIHIAARCLAICAMATLCARTAAADEVVGHPVAPRLYRIPTGHPQPAGGGHGAAGLDHRGASYLALTYGLGGLADVELELEDGFATASFKLAAGQGRLAPWQPATALAFRKSVDGQDRELAHLQLAASYSAGMFGLHAGATLWTDPTALRPFGGLEWRPPIYPRTTLLAELDYERAQPAEPTPSWRAHWGIRYQALSWGSIELGVRHRATEAIGDSTVFVRVNGVAR